MFAKARLADLTIPEVEQSRAVVLNTLDDVVHEERGFRRLSRASHNQRGRTNLIILSGWLNKNYFFLAEELREAGLIEDVGAFAA